MWLKSVVLVAGVHGVSGYAAGAHWASVPGAQVYGLSRRSAPLPKGMIEIIGDLLDPGDLQRKLGKISFTHVVFGAYVEKPTAAERSEVNVAIIKNLFDVVEKTSPSLRHVTFYQGGKAYGADLGPFKTPAREDDPRLMPPNFYYDQEDFLRSRQQGKSWHWTALRPEATVGFGIGNPMNLGMSIAVYAAISKELGLPLRFPGTEKSFRVLYQITSAEILAQATIWAGQSAATRNEIFNITNGDYFRWRYLWPRIAAMFDMPAADPVPTRLMEFDNITSTIKARRAGFHECLDTEDMFREFFRSLRKRRVIP